MLRATIATAVALVLAGCRGDVEEAQGDGSSSSGPAIVDDTTGG